MTPLLTVVTPPAALVSLADAKAHLRVETSDDDALIAGFVAAAAQTIDGPAGWLGRALGTQTLKLTAPHFPGCGELCDWRNGWSAPWTTCSGVEIRLRCPPVQSVTGIVYKDPTGAAVTLDPASYALLDRLLFPLAGAPWPSTSLAPDAVQITYVAGYEDGELPAPIRAAILLMTGTLYANRNDPPSAAGLVSDRLLGPFRVFA